MKKKEIVLNLYDIGAIKFGGPFNLKNGKISPYYFDLRILSSYPETLKEVGLSMLDLTLRGKEPNILCGIPSSGLSIANSMSFQGGLPCFYTRKEPIIYKELANDLRKWLEQSTKAQKGGDYYSGFKKAVEIIEGKSGLKTHGIESYCDGEYPEDAKIGIVDDLINTAETKLEAIDLINQD